MFSHLRSHSYYSLLMGLPSPESLAKEAANQNMSALGLTDYHSLTGAIEFIDACHHEGIKPIIGTELTITLPNPLSTIHGIITLLAENREGWSNLCRLLSSNYINSLLPFEILTEHTQGLICLIGGRKGVLVNLLKNQQIQHARSFLQELISHFQSSLYIELQFHSPEDNDLCRTLAGIAAHYHLPTVGTHDINYITSDEQYPQKVLSAIRENRPINQLHDEHVAAPNSFFKNSDQMKDTFQEYAVSLERTREIVDRCKLDLELGKPVFPDIQCPPSMTPIDVLRQKAEIGVKRLYGSGHGFIKKDINERLNRELAIIDDCGYAPLFLIVEEILDFARKNGIPYSSRGSAASSLVAHCLGITSPDPIRLNLYFERFLNPARATPPDIDTDICSRGRDQVIHHIYERYGEERVATVCTINRFRTRSALREVAKAHELSASEISRITDSIPNRWYRSEPQDRNDDEPFEELYKQYPSPKYKAIIEDTKYIIGIPHHLSVHPGGIVISPGRMTDWVPTQMATKGVLITQLDLDSIERIGLVKIDLLGIRGLTVLGDVAEKGILSIPATPRNNSHPDHKVPNANITTTIDKIPNSDPLVSEMIRNGKTIGCFQIESPGMRNTLKEIHAQTIDDIMVALSLYRPGPLMGGSKKQFVQRHLGNEVSEYLHPSLKPLLGETYGVILYQEQVLRIAHELGCLSLADADTLRRAMSHFDPGKEMENLREKFIGGTHSKHNIPREIAERIWQLMAAFAGYGYPKAHAASYAQISWRSAWCKCHYPDYFMASVLANWGGYYNQSIYISEAIRLGLKVRPPHINYSQKEFCVAYPDGNPILYMGLDQVRELSKATQTAIIRRRPYHSLTDFLIRVDPRPEEAKNLAAVGALEGYGSIPDLLAVINQRTWKMSQFPLFPIKLQDQVDWTILQKSEAENSILGVSVTYHPLELVVDRIKSANIITTLEAASHVGESVRVSGIKQSWRRSHFGSSGVIYRMTLEDLEGYIDVIIRQQVYNKYRSALKQQGPLIVEGNVDLDNDKGEAQIGAEKIWLI